MDARKVDVQEPLSTQELRKRLAGRWFLCHTPAGWTEELKGLLEPILERNIPRILFPVPQNVKLGIAIPAYRIPQEVISRCVRTLEAAQIPVSYRIYVETEASERAESRNRAIAKLYNDCDIILTLDVDCLVPPGLIDWALSVVRHGVCAHATFRKIDLPEEPTEYRWEEWLRVPPWGGGQGAFNVMTKEDWLRVGGWDERLKGWGGEDDILWWRMSQLGIAIVKTASWPFMHVNHPLRGRSMEVAKRNFELGKTTPPCNFLWARIREWQNIAWPIPKKIHQCWIGPLHPPKQWLQTWQTKHPDWDYHFWTEKEILSLPLTLEKHYHAMPKL
ncbi:MAG TPA: galactosyltransferase-related protein, partial [Thermoguttaceae bacterium]|nr:galactosyltransferase-related protein [Thermoguttaceae bacterium]